MTDFTLSATVQAPYEPTLERVRAHLADAGFGVLTEIDLRATLAAKLGVEVAPHMILGACRPELAHLALQADPRIAAMLPCNVAVSAVDESTTQIEVFDPAVMTSFSDEPKLVEVAADARDRLLGMLASLTSDPEASSATSA